MEEITKKRTAAAESACKDAAAADSTSDENKRTKVTNMLTILDENSLLQVLLRTGCEDHNALRQTCRRFQSIIDSELFRQERAQQEWAQVETHVLTAEENYRQASEFPEDDPDDLEELSTFRDDYCELGYIPVAGAIQNEFRILVDGKVGGSGSFTLIERNGGSSSSSGHQSNNNFHATCDAISQEVHDTGCLFFDKKGRPRMPSLKSAMDMDTSNHNTGSTSTSTSSTGSLQKNYFLYLEKFKLNPEHRAGNNGTTWVGAKALRSLLLNSPLKDKWSVVIYIADADACFTEQDRKRSMDQRDLFYSSLVGSEPADERVLRERKDWEERLRILSKVDLCQFLRAGFQQATDSLQKSHCLYAFAVPAILSRPMLSHKEALAVNIVDKKDLSTSSVEMSTMDSKLLSFVVSSCAKRKDLCEAIRRKQATSPPTREVLGVELDRSIDEGFQLINRSEQQNQEFKETMRFAMEQQELIQSSYEQMKGFTSQPGFSARMEQVGESERNEMQSRIANIEARKKSWDSSIVALNLNKSVMEGSAARTAKSKASFEKMRSQRETMIEESFQHGLTAHAEELATACTALTRHDSEVKAEVANLVGENSDGASINNSNALHACAASLTPEYIDLLLEFVPDGERRSVLNKYNTRGITPLMAVALVPHQPRLEMAEKLIGLGADKNITDVFGETALGKFRAMRQSMIDERLRFGYHAPHPQEVGEHARMERLLRPVGGPTAADESYLHDSDDESDFRWDEED